MATSLHLPPTYLLSTHLATEELHALEDQIPSLTWDIQEAELVLGKISKRERAIFELRRLNLRTEELLSHPREDDGLQETDDGPSRKRRKVSPHHSDFPPEISHFGDISVSAESAKIVKVLKLSWLTESLAAGTQLPIEDYLVYIGRKLPPAIKARVGSHQGDEPKTPQRAARIGGHRGDDGARTQRPTLVHETTSEHDIPLPPIPEFLQTPYSCQRPTLANPPNADFIEELKDVRTLRILRGDQVGVRAYSTSIASLSAYPFALQSPSGKLLRLRFTPVAQFTSQCEN